MVVTHPTLLWIRVTDRQTEIVTLRYPEHGARNQRSKSRNRGSRRAVRAIRFIAAAILTLATHPAFSEARAARALAMSVPLPGVPIGDRPKPHVPATKAP